MKTGHAYHARVPAVIFIVVLGQIASPVHAAPTDITDVPMAIKNTVKPNIMFMLDNSGSMNNIVPDAPFDPKTTYLASCPAGNIVAGGAEPPAFPADSQTVDIRVSSTGSVWIRKGGTDYEFGTGADQRCFNPTLRYNARLNGDDGGSPSGYLDAVYTGNYLNWYFGAAPNYTSRASFGSGAERKAGTRSRLEIAQSASKGVLDTLNSVRVGLSTYNGGNGGKLLEVMGDLDAAKRSAMQSEIDGLIAGGNTPLGETLADIGRYFATGYTGDLTLHSGAANQQTSSVSEVFPHAYQNASGVGSPPAPIQYWCQKSFAILMTDGRPQGDQNEDSNISAHLRDYDGDCAVSGANCRTHDRKPLPASGVDQYESAGSDYLNDVAQALFQMDLRPDLTAPAGTTKKNNVLTYTIGFADEQVQSDPLMADTASKGGGLFLTAKDASSLIAAFDQATKDILAKDGSAAAVAVSNPKVNAADKVFQSSFNSGSWSGDLRAYTVDLATGTPNTASPVWSAQALLDARSAASRSIVTYSGTSGSNQGIQFQPAAASTPTKLSSTQQTLLNSTVTPPGPSDGAAVVAYLRGDNTKDGTDYRDRKYQVPDPSSTATPRPNVTRTHLLGDIINAEPVVVGAPQFDYGDACYSSTAASCSTSFKASNAGRTKMVFQGANDGMLHAFRVEAGSAAGEEAGSENWAYVPNLLLDSLNALTKKVGLVHRYYVDATPVVGDVDFNKTFGASGTPDWRTVLIGGLGKGGRGFYALDVTTPNATGADAAAKEADAASKVLWEFPNSSTNTASITVTSPAGSTTTTMNNNKIGYSFGKPIIVKTKAHGWVVLVTSGYNNGSNASGADGTGGDGRGYLWVLNAKTGALLHGFDASDATVTDYATTPSGLAHISAYVENAQVDNTVQYVYGGNLRGNVWRFDLNNADTSNWKVKRLATLVDDAGTAQPITTEPELAKIIDNGTEKRMVYVGTGRYLGDSDISTTQTQSMYGIVDDLSTPTNATPVIAPLRSSLQQQTLTALGDGTRSSSETSVNYSERMGWYIDLPTSGERINTNPVLALGALVFTSNVPSSAVCSLGGSSYLNILDYRDGKVLKIRNSDGTYTWLSSYLGNTLASRPVLIQLPNGRVKVTIGRDDADILTKDGPPSGGVAAGRRVSWKEVTSQ